MPRVYTVKKARKERVGSCNHLGPICGPSSESVCRSPTAGYLPCAMKTCTTDRHFWTKSGTCQCGELSRCCVAFGNGRQCKFPTVAGASWCKRHNPVMRAESARTSAVIRAEAAEDHSEEDED